MDLLNTQARFTSLLENDVLARLERMRLLPRRRLTNRSRGEHHAAKGGTSTEFADYRDYVPGDDVRNVDWNIFARLERPYVKLYRHEEEMHVVSILDASSSMQFEGKFERAKQLAATFGLMGLMNVERVSCFSCNHVGKDGAGDQYAGACCGRGGSHMRSLPYSSQVVKSCAGTRGVWKPLTGAVSSA